MFSHKDSLFHGPPLDIPPLKCRNLGQFFIDEMFRLGDKIYQLDAETGEKWTYAQTGHLTIRVIHELRKQGISKGKIVCLSLLNHMSVMPIVYAILSLGATINPVHPDYDEYEYYYLLTFVKPDMIICDTKSENKLKKVTKKMDIEVKFLILERDFQWIKIDKLEESDMKFRGEVLDVDNTNAFIYFTSGTTGAVKGVPITHNHFYYSTRAPFFCMPEISETQVTLSYAPMTWMSCMEINALIIYGEGIRVVANYVPEKHISVLKKCKVNWLAGHPFYLLEALKSPEFDEEISSQLKIITFGGGPSTKDQIDSYVKAFPNAVVLQLLASTEMFFVHLAFNARTELDLISSKRYAIGKILSYLTGKLIDVDTKEVITEKNKPGELLIKSPYMFQGYYNNETASKDAIDSEGFYHTGDIFTVDDDDCFYFMGRSKDRLVYDHFELDVIKIETIIAKHPAVEDVCLLGKPDYKSYCLPMAFIVKKKGFEHIQEEDIIHFVEERVEDYERLRGGVQFLNAFPKTISGKIRKNALKELLN